MMEQDRAEGGNEDTPIESIEKPMSRGQKSLVVSYSILCFVLPSIAVMRMYPGAQIPQGPARAMFFAGLLGIALGAVHSLASISMHAGKRDLSAPWMIFYLSRPFTGGGVALVTCLVLMSGIGGFSVDPATHEGELILLAWAALAGLYSEPALNKLKELFTSIFSTGTDRSERNSERADKDERMPRKDSR
jgi:hypothetical protein